MRFYFASCLVWQLVLLAVSAKLSGSNSSSPLKIDGLAERALNNLKLYTNELRNSTGTCTFENAAKRREWGDLLKSERKEYIDAVLCLSTKLSITPLAEFPGVRSRYDDFVATHINQTMTIHATSYFLPWHRYYVWTYEKALREECGYKGYQPYWNWPKYATSPLTSPIFDSSDSSLSGNGSPSNTTNSPLNSVSFPNRGGGGCITTGPLVNFTVNLGPVQKLWNEVPDNPVPGGKGYNPRCIRRDISQHTSTHSTSDKNVTDLITKSKGITAFQTTLEWTGDPSTPGILGVHSGGHYTHGGDPGGDIFMSPGDPVFFLHHAGIDRTWWTWQNMDPEKRTYEIGLTRTMFNFPPSKNGTVEDMMDLGVNGKEIRIREAMSSVNGPFCYVYV